MSIDHWTAFVVASCVVLVIPGPTILTVISYSISHGNRAKFPLAAAVALGDTTTLILSLVGVGALLAASTWWFTIVKLVGGVFLIYLGVRLFRSDTSATLVEVGENSSTESMWKLFVNTWFVTAMNPKGIIFFVAFLPQFLDPTAEVAPQLWIVSVTFVVLAAFNALSYALFASKARRLLSSPGARRRFNRGGGSLLAMAGAWTLAARPAS